MLTTEQIQSLFTFCRKHFVYYYDVQVELVDHLANAVELEMQKDSKISFERALEKVHESFGLMGFAPLVAEKEKMALRNGRKLFWDFFKEQFNWPKVTLFFLLSILFFSIFSSDLIPMQYCFIAIIIIGCFSHLYQTLMISRVILKSGKKFLLGGISQFVGIMWIPLNIFSYSRVLDKYFFSNTHSAFSTLLLSLFLSLFIIITMALWQTVSSAKNSLYKNYPEVFLSKNLNAY